MIILKDSCPNCGGEIDDELLLKGSVCKSCLAPFIDYPSTKIIASQLKENGKLLNYQVIASLEEEVELFRQEFRKAIGNEPWLLQVVWAKRVLLDESFSIIAPTGIGKTVFCLLMALYLIKHRNRRCYVILPSSILVEQASSRVIEFMEKLQIEKDVLAYYHSGLDKTVRREMLDKIRSGEFKLLITTDRFLLTRLDAIAGKRIDNIFVDDVDSFLKSPKNIDRIITVLGFSPKIIPKVFEMIKLRKRLSSMNKEVEREYTKIAMEIDEEKRKAHGKLVVAGATLKSKLTKRILLFNELLGFEVGGNPKFIRNIVDFKMKSDREVSDIVTELIKTHGGGALVFVPIPYGKDFARDLTERLNESGVRAYFYEKMEEGILEKFRDGEFSALVGIASSRSPFARGIDLPEVIRYAIFTGVPRREIRINKYETNPNKLYMVLTHVLEIMDEDEKVKALQIIQDLKKIVPVRRELVEKISRVLSKEEQVEPGLSYAISVTKRAADFASNLLTEDFIKRLEETSDISIKRVDGELRLTIPDVNGYLQASGRTSRLFAGGITRGLCILLEDDEKAFVGLTRRLKFLLEDFEWVDYDYEEAKKEFNKVDKDRELLRQIREGSPPVSIFTPIREALMIVESPTKARTFAKFFGRASRRKVGNLILYTTQIGETILDIVATMGHITDLSLQPGYHGVIVENDNLKAFFSYIKKCETCGHQFVDLNACPICGGTKILSKKSVVDVLRKIALTVNEVYVATDPDAEGEKIAYDVTCLIKPYNPNIYRLEFHEVSRKALINAIANKHHYSINLVSAQLVRRIEDRWFGFELSRKLWDYFGSKNLSAGRVQTPVLGWIVKRMMEAREKKTIVRAHLANGLELVYENPSNLDEIKKKFESKELVVEVPEVCKIKRVVNPPPPYTTATLLQDAFTFLHYPVDLTMRLAQELYESGFITYHRTDSTTVSTTGLNLAKEYIETKKLGNFIPRTYAREGAHECIRPVRMIDKSRVLQYMQIGLIKPVVEITDKHLKLYDLIFRRFIASQMEPATVIVQSFKAILEKNELTRERVVDVLVEGFNKIFPMIKREQEVQLGEYSVTDMRVLKVPAVQMYTEGDIISLMREKRIGRPSTYNRIIQVLFDRQYIFEKKSKIIPTKRGLKVYEYLEKNFGEYISEDITRELEETMDRIEDGKENYLEVLKRLREQAQRIVSKVTA
ncbi:MAG: reverse gyrase [Nitrososphaeria archaeon]|nr:reverse gyrase [Nitrososphaeria archaeon]